MPQSPEAPVARFDDLDGALALIRDRGMRATAARRLVLQALLSSDGPVSAEDIADGLGGQLPRSDLASVYRNLQRFAELGLVRHSHVGHGPGLFVLATEDEREYLVCQRCGDVVAIDPVELDDVRAILNERFGYDAHFTHFPIVGRCARCAAELSAGR
ncbi:MAG: Fur family transcriptional regulator [Nocardioidaceae bacterium]